MKDDDFQIELGKTLRRRVDNKPSPMEDRAFVSRAVDNPQSDEWPVFLHLNAIQAIEQHVSADLEAERGGVLLGLFCEGKKGPYIEVRDIITADSAKGTEVSLTFTHDAWQSIHEQMARRGDNLQVVGWYHSHPGLGVFLSEEDQLLHSGFFAEPWQIALVVDPVGHDWRCFAKKGEVLQETQGFHIYAPVSYTHLTLPTN